MSYVFGAVRTRTPAKAAENSGPLSKVDMAVIYVYIGGAPWLDTFKPCHQVGRIVTSWRTICSGQRTSNRTDLTQIVSAREPSETQRSNPGSSRSFCRRSDDFLVRRIRAWEHYTISEVNGKPSRQHQAEAMPQGLNGRYSGSDHRRHESLDHLYIGSLRKVYHAGYYWLSSRVPAAKLRSFCLF